MNQRFSFILLICFLICCSYSGYANINFKKDILQKPDNTKIVEGRRVDVNSISATYYNDGEFFANRSVTGPGFEWPKGSGKYAIFSAALWIGAKVQLADEKEIRVATAGHFGSEYRPGSILIDGKPEDYRQPNIKIYQVNPLFDLPSTNADLLYWPVDKGAPWIDVDKNGEWNPFIDKVGILFRGDTIYPDIIQFCVYNDADAQYHTWIWGKSKPLGIEVRQTVWAFQNMFPNVHFIRFQFYNKSPNVLDSVFFTLWSDPDLGDPFDDFVGCDTTTGILGNHNLGYVYNGSSFDTIYGSKPPAAGFKLLQGPTVIGSINDTAHGFGKKWIGYKNLNLSSFMFFCNPGLGRCYNPDWYDPSLYQQSYNVMQGLTRTGKSWIDPFTSDTIKFVFAGDPVTGQGFIASNLINPGDFRMVMSCGPITMMPEDSQEVVFSAIVSQGSDYINSIINLRRLSNQLNLYMYQPERVPKVSAVYQELYSPPILVKANVINASNVTAIIYNNFGYVLSIKELYDDGMHDDNGINDNIWANWIDLVSDSASVKVSLLVKYNDNIQLIWDDLLTNITIAGKITLDSLIVVSDNINKDLIPNPGENIRFKILVSNSTNYKLKNINFTLIRSLDSNVAITVPNSNLEASIELNSSKIIPTVGYFTINTYPEVRTDTELKLLCNIFDNYENYWLDTLKFKVQPYDYQPIEVGINHLTGNSEGSFKVLIVDHPKIKDNEYEITFKKEQILKFNLVNKTISDTLIKLMDLPDSSGHNIPVTDGFRILRGDITTQTGIKNIEYIPSSNKWFTGSNKYVVDDRNFGIAYPNWSNFLLKNSNLPIEDLNTVEIRFSHTITQKAYRYLSGFAFFPVSRRYVVHPEFRPFVIDSNGTGLIYQDYQRYPLGDPNLGVTVPFTVWEVDRKKGIEKQLNIAIIENNDSLYRIVNGVYQYLGRGIIDGKWWPTTADNGGGEVLVIFSSEYSEIPDTFYTNRNLSLKFEEFDVYYVFSPKLISSNLSFIDEDTLRIIPYQPVTENDKFAFNPYKLLSVKYDDEIVMDYILYNNYPNPFNSYTNIKFIIFHKGLVKLEIFNILGQKVKTLADENFDPGTYVKTWDGKNDNGIFLSSGVYYLRIKFNSYSETRKILFLK